MPEASAEEKFSRIFIYALVSGASLRARGWSRDTANWGHANGANAVG